MREPHRLEVPREPDDCQAVGCPQIQGKRARDAGFHGIKLSKEINEENLFERI
jgi:hypothetical protein